jgi:hypothetical protein
MSPSLVSRIQYQVLVLNHFLFCQTKKSLPCVETTNFPNSFIFIVWLLFLNCLKSLESNCPTRIVPEFLYLKELGPKSLILSHIFPFGIEHFYTSQGRKRTAKIIGNLFQGINLGLFQCKFLQKIKHEFLITFICLDSLARQFVRK